MLPWQYGPAAGGTQCGVAGLGLSGAGATVGIVRAAGVVGASPPCGGGAPIEAGSVVHPSSPIPGTAVSGKATSAAGNVSVAGDQPWGLAAGQEDLVVHGVGA